MVIDFGFGKTVPLVFLLPLVSASFVHLIPQVPWQALPSLDVGLERAARAEYEMGLQAWNLRQAEQGLELFLKSAQKGHEVGEYCFRYGMYHEFPPSDMQQAFRWYKRGARMNHKGSTTMLGKLHLAAGHRDEAMHFLQRTGLPNTGRVVPGMDEPFRTRTAKGCYFWAKLTSKTPQVRNFTTFWWWTATVALFARVCSLKEHFQMQGGSK